MQCYHKKSELSFRSKKPFKCLVITGFVQQNGFIGVCVRLTEVSAKCRFIVLSMGEENAEPQSGFHLIWGLLVLINVTAFTVFVVSSYSSKWQSSTVHEQLLHKGLTFVPSTVTAAIFLLDCTSIVILWPPVREPVCS